MSKNKELPSIQELKRKIEQVKKTSLQSEGKNSAPGAMQVGVDLLSGVLAGSFIGYQLDNLIGTKPIFFIICFFLGIAGSVRNIMRTIKNTNSLDKDSQVGNKTEEK